jgi:hypothetical protein
VSLGYLPQTLIMVFARACAYTSSLFVGLYMTLRWQWRKFVLPTISKSDFISRSWFINVF